MMVIDNIYKIGDQVYLVTDKEQEIRLVYALIVYKGGEVMYKCVCGTQESVHYEFELSKEKNILVAI